MDVLSANMLSFCQVMSAGRCFQIPCGKRSPFTGFVSLFRLKNLLFYQRLTLPKNVKTDSTFVKFMRRIYSLVSTSLRRSSSMIVSNFAFSSESILSYIPLLLALNSRKRIPLLLRIQSTMKISSMQNNILNNIIAIKPAKSYRYRIS